MFSRTSVVTAILTAVLCASAVFGDGVEENWNNFLHYTKIGRFDLAAGYAKAVVDSEPNAVELLALSRANPEGYRIIVKYYESAPDTELGQLTAAILNLIEEGRFTKRTEPILIVEQVKRLSSTARGRLAALKQLQDAGEYAIPYMLDAMADEGSKEELANIIWALPQIGRDAVRPLAAALQTENTAVKAEIIKALGKIGYPQSLAYLKLIVEKDKSAGFRNLAAESIREIDPAGLQLPAAQLFYQLAENYYYHIESLAPLQEADFCNMWFWDSGLGRLSRQEVDSSYFYELMAMRACEWALKADPGFGNAIGLWHAAFFKAESAQIEMPEYFGPEHADATTYATTAGAVYLHQALARAIKDKDAYVALGVVEALAGTAGEKSLMYRFGPGRPLIEALSFGDTAVRYSAAITIAAAGPREKFAESTVVTRILAEAVSGKGNTASAMDEKLAKSYAIRAVEAMLKLAVGKNDVIDLSAAQDALVDATKGRDTRMQILAGRVLAYLKSPIAQRSVAAMSLDANNDINVRIGALGSLGESAKVNGNLLEDGTINAIYSLVASAKIDVRLRSAAAAAFGALNLPSQKVKDLILDQARS
ncbi:MAG TPA: HEAT repeat domain-containing protein [Sedimentisphaerales bacterium]|nr:HEAT repeat domain-containing protein [Sedimentisphaerales bacterium]